MPKAKKNKMVSLTKTKPKMRDHKEAIVHKTQLYINKYKYIYVLSYQNMTTNHFKALRQAQSESKFLMGKNKVIGVAFGTNQQTTYKPNSYRLSEFLHGRCVVFFTNKAPQECQQIFQQFEEQQFATGGTLAEQTIILQKGFNVLQKFSHSIEPHLRQLGLPTRLINSKIQLTSDYILCEEGKPLTVNQCKLLRLMDYKMSRLKFNIRVWYDGKKIHK